MADGFPGRGNQHDWSAALPYYNLGNKYMQSERYEDAIQKYHEAIGKYEYDPDFYINLGVALRRVENLQAAEDAFKHAAALNAKDWMSWSNLANSYLKQDRLEDTIKAFETALTCNPPAAEKEAILMDIADIKNISVLEAAVLSRLQARIRHRQKLSAVARAAGSRRHRQDS